jgi:hypothetical protein
MKLVTGISRLFSRMLGSKNGPLDRTKLVGMYLSTTNDREGYSPELQENRTRRNGKYSHHRERA